MPLAAAKIGLLVVATGRYLNFVEPLIQSADRYFCPNHEVTYFIFTDGTLPETDRVVPLFHPRLGWPFDTMMRYDAHHRYASILSQQDYLYACDADMQFVGEVGDEILSERVATLHPGFINRRGSYETNPSSLAYIPDGWGVHYFAGGFYGGESKAVLEIARINASRITEDLKKGIIAVWHDESHWNRYCIDYPPTLILSPSYCYPEGADAYYFQIWGQKYERKLIALDKNHSEARE